MTRELEKADPRIVVIDPTLRQGKQRTEFKDLDQSHVVVAYLWRESIGTVIGMIRASRMGKPVVVVDPHHIYEEHSTLRTMVGGERVNDIPAAVQKIKNEIFPRLDKTLLVRKATREAGAAKEEQFDPKKLRRAVTHACTAAAVDDDYWIHIIPREVETALRSRYSSIVTSAEIKDEVFQCLDQLSNESEGSYPQLFREQARRLKEKWKQRERERHPDRTIEEWGEELAACQKGRKELAIRLKELETALSAQGNPSKQEEASNGNAAAAPARGLRLDLRQLEQRLQGKKVLCVFDPIVQIFATH